MRHTFGKGAGVAVHLKCVEGADLKVCVVVQELLHDWLKGQKQLLLLLQLFFGGGRQLVLNIRYTHLMRDILKETEKDKSVDVTRFISDITNPALLLRKAKLTTPMASELP